MSDFKEKYYNVFGRVYKFMQDHYDPKTREDWSAIAEDGGYEKSDFEKDMLLLVVAELEKGLKDTLL